MEILFVSTELAPYVKVGGLADVVAALPKALRQLGHKVTVLLPRFPAFEAAGLSLARRLTPLKFALGGKSWDITVFDARLPTQVDLVLVDTPGLFDRDGVYGGRETGEDYPDNATRFAVLSRAAAEIVKQRAASGMPFDIVHCQDWPAALVPTYLRELGKELPELITAKTVLTIHNLAHQGTFPKEALPSLGLPWEEFRIDGIEFYGGLNVLKLGILTADAVTTVSTTYAREIQTPELGYKLDGVLRDRARAIVGITNGVDYAVWNPATDPVIAARYDAEDPANKARCKGALQKELGLPIDVTLPLIASVGRIVEQKGSDSSAAVLPKLLRATEAQVVVAGDGDASLVKKIAGGGGEGERTRGVRARGERAARAPDLRGGRHRPRPEPVRAVRARPDVRAAVRDVAGRAGDGGARGHGRRLRREARDGDGVPVR